MSAVVLGSALAIATLLLATGPLSRQAPVERVTLALVLVVLVLALVSLLGLRLAIYSAGFASTGLVGVAYLAHRASRRYGPLEPIPLAPGEERGGRVLGPVLACFLALYALYPTYFLLGGQDPGVYLVFAARTAKTGGLHLDLPWLRELWEKHPRGIALGYPGIYSLVHSNVSNDASRLSPQFAHLFPALAANAWAFGKIEGLVRVNAPIAVLALAVGFALARRLVGWAPAIAYVLILGLNPAYLWGARITLTETLAALITLTGLLLLLFAGVGGSRSWAACGGVVLGIGVFNRLDAGFSGFAIAAFAAASLVEQKLVPAAKYAAAAYLVASTLGFLDARVHAPFYFEALSDHHHLSAIVALSTAAGFFALAIGFIPPALFARARVNEKVLSALSHEVLRGIVVWILVALFAWPAVDPRLNSHVARELGWYVTPIAWVLFPLGCFVLLRRASWGAKLPLLALAAGTFVAFTVGAHVAPQHIWASRRWVPQVIPLMGLLAVVSATELGRVAAKIRGLRPIVLTAFALAYFVPTLDFDQPFLFRSMLSGLPQAYAFVQARVAALRLAPPLLTSNPHLASVLTYLYDTPTALLGGRTQFGFNDPLARVLLSEGEFGGLNAVGLGPFDLYNSPRASERFLGDYLEITEGRRPHALVTYPLSLDLGEIGGRGFELEVAANHPGFVSEVGIQGLNGSFRTTGRAGTLLRGPNATLARGQYAVDFVGWLAGGGSERQGVLKVTSEHGATVLATAPLRLRPDAQTETWIGGLDFNLDDPATGVDFSVTVEPNVDLTVTRVRLRRLRMLNEALVRSPPAPAAH